MHLYNFVLFTVLHSRCAVVMVFASRSRKAKAPMMGLGACQLYKFSFWHW